MKHIYTAFGVILFLSTVAYAQETIPVVDLGLSVDWATENLGATAQKPRGYYYAYGESQPKLEYSKATYSDSSADPAQSLEGKFRMPTKAEWKELKDKCKWEYVTVGNIAGYKITSKVLGHSNNSIFLPAAGFRSDWYLNENNVSGGYLVRDMPATALVFNKDTIDFKQVPVFYGYNIRPVYIKQHEHILKKIEGVEPGEYILNGHKPYYYCTEPTCKQYFEDKAGKILIGGESELEAWISKDGKGFIPHQHTLELIPGESPIMGKAGYKDHYQCTHKLCKRHFVDPEALREIGDDAALESWKESEGKIPELEKYISIGISYSWAKCNNSARTINDLGKMYSPTEVNGVVIEDAPTFEHWQDLVDNCDFVWTEMEGQCGYKVECRLPDYEDSWLFLPCIKGRETYYYVSKNDMGVKAFCISESRYGFSNTAPHYYIREMNPFHIINSVETFKNWLNKTLIYPEDALKIGRTGSVAVEFFIEDDGSVRILDAYDRYDVLELVGYTIYHWEENGDLKEGYLDLSSKILTMNGQHKRFTTKTKALNYCKKHNFHIREAYRSYDYLKDAAVQAISSSPKWTRFHQEHITALIAVSNDGTYDIKLYGNEKLEGFDEEEEVPFMSVEVAPSFMGGGTAEFNKWVGKNLVYPEIAMENGISGRVMVQFTVEKDGTVTKVKVLRGALGGKELDEEAVRVIKSSPKWIPGQQQGRNVRVQFVFPVVFRLQ